MKILDELVTSEIEFTQLEEIGEAGQNARVFRVRDEQLDVELAAKQLDATAFDNLDEYFSEAQQMERSRHPNVLPVRYASRQRIDTESDSPDDSVYILMPFMKRGSLQARMNNLEQNDCLLSVRDVVRIGLQFLTGLAHIHRHRIVHFDLKPSNILINDSGIAVVADFGLAKYLNAYGAADQKYHYSRHRAPERYEHTLFTSEIDVYQAGLTLYRMINGEAHFTDQWNDYVSNGKVDEKDLRDALRNGEFPDRENFLPHVPNRLRTTIQKALSVDPEERYRTVREMMNDLGRVDQYLDWKIEYNHHKQYYRATLHEDERRPPRTRSLEISKNDDTFDVSASKKVTTSQTIHDWSESGLPNFAAALSHVQAKIRSTDS